MPTRRCLTILASAGVLIITAGTPSHAQAQSNEATTASSPTGKITGRVETPDGRPLANAIIMIRAYAANTQFGTETTDNEGKFEAKDLPQRAYLISAMLPGYVAVPRDPDLNPIGYYRLGDSVNIQLVKGGVITGSVKKSNGEPVIAVAVRAYMIRDQKGQPSRFSTPNGVQSTDDRGVYRIFGLAPGTYVVSAGAPGQFSGYVDPFADYAPTYAPSGTRDTAAEIVVNAGQEMTNVDIRFREEPGHTMSGKVISSVSDPRYGWQIMLTSILNGVAQAGDSTFAQPGAAGFMFSGVADGDYYLTALGNNSGERTVSEPRRITVRGHDVEGIELTATALGSIAGNVVLEDSKAPECQGKRRPLFNETVIGAWHNEKTAAKDQPQFVWGLGAPTVPDKDGNFVLRTLAPSQYRFNVRPMAKYWYLKSITWPATSKAPQTNQPIDAARNWSTMRAGERLTGLTITFAEGASSITGRVEAGEGQKLPSRTFVFLAPAEKEKANDILRYFVTLAADDGSFALGNLAPGNYWVIARQASENDSNMLSKLRLPDETELRAKLLSDGERQKTQTQLKPCQNVSDYHLIWRANQ